MSLPKLQNIPKLDFNFEGLNRHSHLITFFSDSDLNKEQLKTRKWFLHTIVSACRHYSNARDLVAKQESANQERDGGVILYIFDVSEHLENCITASYRATSAIHKVDINNLFTAFKEEYSGEIDKLCKIRNQFDHMYTQIVSGQTGKGPIVITYCDEGKKLQFRSKKISSIELSTLLNALYSAVCSLFPQFDHSSAPELGGPPILKMTMTINTVEKENDVQTIEVNPN